jgi:hypothetical protein
MMIELAIGAVLVVISAVVILVLVNIALFFTLRANIPQEHFQDPGT